MRMTTIVGAGANSADVVQRLVGFVISILPTMEELGLVQPGELKAETLPAQGHRDRRREHELRRRSLRGHGLYRLP
jgi:hypothetical protein